MLLGFLYKDPTNLLSRVLYLGPLFPETPVSCRVASHKVQVSLLLVWFKTFAAPKPHLCCSRLAQHPVR